MKSKLVYRVKCKLVLACAVCMVNVALAVPNYNVSPQNVSFLQLNGFAPSQSHISGNKDEFGRTETAATVFNNKGQFDPPTDDCKTDCFEAKTTSANQSPSYSQTIIRKVVNAGVSPTEIRLDQNGDPYPKPIPYTSASRNEVIAHENGHVEVNSWIFEKMKSFYESNVVYTSSCQDSEESAKSEWKEHEVAVVNASLEPAAGHSYHNKHGVARVKSDDSRWEDSKPNWLSQGNVISDLNGEGYSFDSDAVSDFPKEDDECEEDEGPEE
ncbi:MAG: hypothetical protein AAGH72_04180 [Verrucomicrobiota bacterium]